MKFIWEELRLCFFIDYNEKKSCMNNVKEHVKAKLKKKEDEI